MNDANRPAPTTPEDMPALEADGTPVPAFGEVVSRRPWYLVLLVFPFGVLLAVAPFLFHLEPNHLSQVLEAYDAACRGPSPSIRCVDRRAFLPRIEPVRAMPGTTEAFRLILAPRPGAIGQSEGRWLVIRDGDFWRVLEERPSP